MSLEESGGVSGMSSTTIEGISCSSLAARFCSLYSKNFLRSEIALNSDRTRSRFTRSVTSLIVSVLATRSSRLSKAISPKTSKL